MIFAYYLLGNNIAGASVYGSPYNAATAVNNSVFPDKALSVRFYVKFNALRSVRPKLSAQILPVCVNDKLIYPVGVVAETVVKVIVHYRGTRAKRYLPPEIGKKVKTVVMMVLGYGKLGMKHQPVNKICKLAHSAARARGNLAV